MWIDSCALFTLARMVDVEQSSSRVEGSGPLSSLVPAGSNGHLIVIAGLHIEKSFAWVFLQNTQAARAWTMPHHVGPQSSPTTPRVLLELVARRTFPELETRGLAYAGSILFEKWDGC